ncbi:MAG TPA: glycoside hydrolase family 95 protein [Edaphobacter sp.]|nr:glycoside hydrolase family 95 protein [Edaphobacter sp.]
MSTRREFLASAALIALASNVPLDASEASRTAGEMDIWFAQEAKHWLEALPLGNGNQGAMIYGGVGNERLALSDSTAWSGAPGEHEVNPQAREHLGEIRKLIFDRKYAEATHASRNYLPGRGRNFGTNLPLPDLLIQFDSLPAPITDYRRSLDLETAVAGVSFEADGRKHVREAFASHAHKVLVYRIAHPASFRVSFAQSPLPTTIRAEKNSLLLHGRAVESKHSDGKSGVEFEIQLEVITQGGHLEANGQTISITGSSSATILIAIATSFHGNNPATACQRSLAAARSAYYQKLKSTHIADYAPLFHRLSLKLGNDSRRDTPTDLRRQAVSKGASDPGLHALFFHYREFGMTVLRPQWAGRMTSTSISIQSKTTGLQRSVISPNASFRSFDFWNRFGLLANAPQPRCMERRDGWCTPSPISGVTQRRAMSAGAFFLQREYGFRFSYGITTSSQKTRDSYRTPPFQSCTTQQSSSCRTW